MTIPRPFRFGVIAENAKSEAEWVAKARRIEQLGYTTLLVPDHLGGQFAPIPALLAAAKATNTLRIGSYVFNNDFRHPVMLAREAATLDILSGGRFELGIGAGYLKPEYAQLGIAYDPPSVRIRRLEETIHIVKELLAGKRTTFSGTYYRVDTGDIPLLPVQQPHLPLLIGGAGRQMLSLAAKEASIVSLGAKALADGSRLDVTDATLQATERKIEWIRQAAAERFYQLELNIIVFAVILTEDRSQAAQQLSGKLKMGEEQILTMPHYLIGTPSSITDVLLENRLRYGISYISIFEEESEIFAPVVARLAEQ